MLAFIAAIAVAACVGIAIFGHILLLQAIFTSADHADGKRERHVQQGWQPDVRI